MLAALLLLAAGADLPAVDRAVTKEPAYTAAPGYLLLLFGPDARRVWLVRDGDTLHVDRDGDGDLTGPGEAVKAGPAAGGKRWEVGTVGPHAGLDISVDKLSVFKTVADGHPLAKALLAAEPDAEVVSVRCDVRVPGLPGGGADGRVDVAAGFYDHGGFLRFAPTREAASVVWLGGPLSIDAFGWRQPTLKLGRGPEFYTSVGTRGSGPGTFASVGHDRLMPRQLAPVADVRFAPKEKGGSPVVARYELTKRCCGINLYAPLLPPQEAGPGLATVTLSYPAWEAGKVAPTAFNVLMRPAPAVKSEAVSAKLVRTLPHPDRAASVTGVRLSADGRRLFGAGYPSGILQVWDAATGAELATVRTPPGYRGSADYAELTADWGAVVVPVEGDRVVRGEKDGKKTMRREYAGEVRVYDPATGRVRRTVPTPGRGPLAAVPSPDGSRLVTLERPGHELGTGRWSPGDRVVWRDLDGGGTKELLPGYGMTAFSPAGDRFAVAASPLQDDADRAARVVLFAADGTTRHTLLTEPKVDVYWPAFSPDGGKVACEVRPDDKAKTAGVRVWDAATGRPLADLRAAAAHLTGPPRFSPDGGRVAAAGGHTAHVWDVASGKPAVAADVGAGNLTQATALGPDGTTLAVAVMLKPDPSLGNEPDPLDMGQPWVDLFDVATGTRRERLVCPHGWLTSLAFAPDGRTLFAGANGGVHVFGLRAGAVDPSPKR